MSFPYGYEHKVGDKVLVYRRGYGDKPVVPITGTISKVGTREFAVKVDGAIGPETIRFSLRHAEAIGNDRIKAEPFDERAITEAQDRLAFYNTMRNVQFLLGELGSDQLRRGIHAKLGTTEQAVKAEALLRETVEKLAALGVSGLRLP